MRLIERINFRQTKYMLPAILLLPLLIASYFIIDLFQAEKAEIDHSGLQSTEFLNPTLPDAKLKSDGIGSKYENMNKAWGRISDETAVNIIERDNPDEDKEQYESKYSDDDIALLDGQADSIPVAQATDTKTREQEALAELERALAEARLKGRNAVQPTDEPTDSTAMAANQPPQVNERGTVEEESKAVNALTDDDPTVAMVKKIETASDYFNTIAGDEGDPKLIKAIIDEDIKATDGSRVRLRLLDDVEINECVVKQGTYLYATMSGFSSQRVKGNISSILVGDELVKVSLSLYDTDGMEGLYVPQSDFRETTKDIASGAMSNTSSGLFTTSSTSSNLAQMGIQALSNAYSKTANAISKAIKKNRAKLKYGTFVYIVNSKEKRSSN